MTSAYPPHRTRARALIPTPASLLYLEAPTAEDWVLTYARVRDLSVAWEDGLFHLDGFSARTMGELAAKLFARWSVS